MNEWDKQQYLEFISCLCALRNYKDNVISKLESLHERNIRDDEQIVKIHDCVMNNASFFEFMANNGPSVFGISDFVFPDVKYVFLKNDLDQLCAALKSAARDWTEIGDVERKETYLPIINKLRKYVDKGRVLVPGAGACRLAVEIATDGYVVDANESAFIMLIVSYCAMFKNEEHFISPFVHQLSGLTKLDDSLLTTKFPDLSSALVERNSFLDPSDLIKTRKLFLKAGSFETTYFPVEQTFDAIVSCFFIDVVNEPRILIEQFYSLLNKGGILINFGPVISHSQNFTYFATLTLEDIDNICENVGFEKMEQQFITTTYSQNPNTHSKMIYDCILTVYRK